MEKQPRNRVDGILLVDKSPDWTSFDAVNLVKRHFWLDKVGHCGTLDPFATGLLVILLGKATRLQDQLMGKEKCYRATMKLGERTETEDLTGEVTSVQPVPSLTKEQLQEQANAFLGEILQTPPMHSAIKVHGQPLYKLARKGQTVERKARPVTIHNFTIDDYHEPLVDFTVTCSKGTYIRTLGADLAERLGCGGHLVALRRLSSGDHTVEQACTVEDLKNWDLEELKKHLLPLPEVAP